MFCDKCKKNKANVLYTEIINDKKKEQHLCEECAMNFTKFQMAINSGNNEFSINELLTSLLNNYYNEYLSEKNNSGVRKCSFCGMTYQEIMKAGRFGCAQCYTSFYDDISKLLRGIQGSDIYKGNKPEGHASISDTIKELSEIDKLEIRLKTAIKEENYEEAAVLRDKIKDIKKEAAEQDA